MQLSKLQIVDTNLSKSGLDFPSSFLRLKLEADRSFLGVSQFEMHGVWSSDNSGSLVRKEHLAHLITQPISPLKDNYN